MRGNIWRMALGAILAGGSLTTTEMLAVTGIVEFQNGLNGYTGTFDREIDERGGDFEITGSDVVQFGIDGFAADSPDNPALIRFDDIFGGGANQVPTGAFILDARLQLTTTDGGNAATSGPWGVAGLLAPFDSSTVYADFPAFRGPWWQDGTATRPVGNFGGAAPGDVVRARIQPLVQQWSDGTLANNGLAVQAGFVGTGDGWNIYSTGHGTDPAGEFDVKEFRPKLIVDYTTEPIEINRFQRDLDGYQGDTMVWLEGNEFILGASAASDDVTTDGTLVDQAFLDGPDFGGSHDDAALVKFGDVFGEGTNQAPADVPVVKAWLRLTTGDTSNNARSVGSFSVHRMLSDWTTTSLHSEFDLGVIPVDGFAREGADISEALDVMRGMSVGSELWFDVTSYLEGVRNGDEDYGLAVLAGTSDGLQIHFNGSVTPDARPMLYVASGMLPIVAPELPGDFNGDNVVGAADYVLWRNNEGTDFELGGNGDETGPSAGVVDEADYNLWVANFGTTGDISGPLGSGGAVPEPSSIVMVLMAGLATMIGRRCNR